jgi:ribosomal protein S1
MAASNIHKDPVLRAHGAMASARNDRAFMAAQARFEKAVPRSYASAELQIDYALALVEDDDVDLYLLQLILRAQKQFLTKMQRA